MKRKLELTLTECRTLLLALRIAIEDGSIYGAGFDDVKVDRIIEGLRRKLGDKNLRIDSGKASP